MLRLNKVIFLVGIFLVLSGRELMANKQKSIAPSLTQSLLGPGHEQFWTANGSQPRNIDLIKRQIAVLEGNVRKANPAYAEPLRELREELTSTTSLKEYQTLAQKTIDKVSELEAEESNPRGSKASQNNSSPAGESSTTSSSPLGDLGDNKFVKEFGGMICGGLVVVLIIAMLLGRRKFRCPRCNHQDRLSNIKDGRCPNCGSIEF